jgi:hypothetical protein
MLFSFEPADGTTETLPLGDEKFMVYLMKMTPNGNELVFTNRKYLYMLSRRKSL